MWGVGGHHATLDRDLHKRVQAPSEKKATRLFLLQWARRRTSLEGTANSSAWPYDGGQNWKRTGKKEPEAVATTLRHRMWEEAERAWWALSHHPYMPPGNSTMAREQERGLSLLHR